MGELARDFYISSERERREWEAGRRLCGEWCQQSVARFPAGEGAGAAELDWPPLQTNHTLSSRDTRQVRCRELTRGEQTVRGNYGRG